MLRFSYTTSMKVVWSLHDISPDTLEGGLQILDHLAANGIREVAVLVIPGQRPWDQRALEKLRALEAEGYPLLAHGWSHRAPGSSGAFEWAHSRFFSKDAAEHFGKDANEILSLVNQSYDWFVRNGLNLPTTYIPPAWYPGRLPRALISNTPFRFIETLSGFYDRDAAAFFHLPLVGFQAFTRVEAEALRVSNSVNERLAAISKRPLRVAIHPRDFTLRLAPDLERLIRQCNTRLFLDQSATSREPVSRLV